MSSSVAGSVQSPSRLRPIKTATAARASSKAATASCPRAVAVTGQAIESLVTHPQTGLICKAPLPLDLQLQIERVIVSALAEALDDGVVTA